MNTVTSSQGYVGRFAPSPSGHLHFGSLVTAVGSFLQAKSQAGKWLLRIEDIDPPREVAGASESIRRCLEAHHLFWDDEVIYQSHRSNLYLDKIQYLTERGLTFYCHCTRAELAKLKIQQLCGCVSQNLSSKNSAIRFNHLDIQQHFTDQLLGQVKYSLDDIPRQFTIKRKDQLFAYQLAVVVDDIQQGITEVARGADLIDATILQLALYQAFDCPAPKFLHFPVVVTQPGKKLSKQNHAPAVDPHQAASNISHALEYFGLVIPKDLKHERLQNILDWAIGEWDLTKIPAKTECIDNRIGQADSI